MTTENDILSHVRIDDLPEGSDMRRIAERCGLSVALSLYSSYAGLYVYIPKGTLSGFVRRFTAENRRRYSPKELALALGTTESHIYRILRENQTHENQQELFASATTEAAPEATRADGKTRGKR
jgi:hypothetical protein